MKSMKKLAAAMSAAGLLVVAAPAQAIPSLTIVDTNPGGTNYGTQVVDPFAGFDYVSSATAVTSGFNFGAWDPVTMTGANGAAFTTYFLASTVAIQQPGGATAAVDGLTTNGIADPNRWEITVSATIQEFARCLNAACTTIAYTAIGGSYDIYYDSTADSNRNTGLNFENGTRIIGGSILPGVAGNFEQTNVNPVPDGTGTGDFTFFGTVDFTETDTTEDAYIDPKLANSVAGANLRLGNALTSGWTRPVSFLDAGFANLDPADGLIVFQGDGSQSFSVIPEPGSLALMGLSLVGLFGGIRRRKA